MQSFIRINIYCGYTISETRKLSKTLDAILTDEVLDMIKEKIIIL